MQPASCSSLSAGPALAVFRGDERFPRPHRVPLVRPRSVTGGPVAQTLDVGSWQDARVPAPLGAQLCGSCSLRRSLLPAPPVLLASASARPRCRPLAQGRNLSGFRGRRSEVVLHRRDPAHRASAGPASSAGEVPAPCAVPAPHHAWGCLPHVPVLVPSLSLRRPGACGSPGRDTRRRAARAFLPVSPRDCGAAVLSSPVRPGPVSRLPCPHLQPRGRRS